MALRAGDDAAGNSLKISYLLPQFPVPTETFAISDIAALRKLGHEVVVHTVKPPPGRRRAGGNAADLPADLRILRPRLRQVWRWPGLLFRRAGSVGLLLRLIAPALVRQPRAALTSLLCIPRLIEIGEELRRLRPDVVHVFWARHPALALPMLKADDAPAVRSIFVGAYDLVADDFLVRQGIDAAQVAFSHAETNRPFLESRVPAGVHKHIVHRGIPLPTPDAAAVRDRNLWLTASALVPAKRVDRVIAAFAGARTTWPDIRLMVCGDGPDRPRLEQMCRDLGCAPAVNFAGHVRREDLFRRMQRAGIFWLMSEKESERLPNVLKEALWSGCAIVTTRTPGIEELIPDAGIGHIVEDDAALARAVQAIMMESEADAASRAQRARKMIEAAFSSETSMAQYARAWQNLLHPLPADSR